MWLFGKFVGGSVFGTKDVRDGEIWFRPPMSCAAEVSAIPPESMEAIRGDVLQWIAEGRRDKDIIASLRQKGTSETFAKWVTSTLRCYGDVAILKRPQDP